MVSVIIPTYNSRDMIIRALESVVSQTYQDLEIVVADDGSTDGTAQLVRKQFSQVRYFTLQHQGVSHARNFGISVSRGEYIAFLDADDMWLPEKLEKQVAVLEQNPKVGMVFTENLFFTAFGLTGERTSKRQQLMSGDLVRNIFLKSYVVTSTVMVRRQVLQQVGQFEEDLAVAEDDNLWMRIAMGHGVQLIDEPLALYHLTDGSLSRTRCNIRPSIEKHIELLAQRYPDLYRHLGRRSVRLKLNDLLFSEGYHYFSLEQRSRARELFLQSFLWYPFRWKPLAYALSSCLPTAAINRIRGAKRLLVSAGR